MSAAFRAAVNYVYPPRTFTRQVLGSLLATAANLALLLHTGYAL